MIYIVDSPNIASFQSAKAKSGFDQNNIYLIKSEGRLWTRGTFLGPKVSLHGNDEEKASGKVLIQNATWGGDAITLASGGTGITSYTKGDILYANDNNSLAKLGIGTSGQVLSVNNNGTLSWVSLGAGVSSLRYSSTASEVSITDSAKTGAVILGDAAAKLVTTTIASGNTGLPTSETVYSFVTNQIADVLNVADITVPASSNDYIASVTKDSANKTLTFTPGSFVGLTINYSSPIGKSGSTYKPNDASGTTIYVPTALSHLSGMGTMTDGNIVVGDNATGIKNSGYSIRTADLAGLGVNENSIPTSSVVKTYVDNKITSSMYFRGVVTVGANSLTFPNGTTSYNIGDAWRVGTVTPGSTVTVGGKKLEEGDLIIATAAKSAAANFSASDFVAVQNNVDVFSGATDSAAGSIGLVPAPAANQHTHILLGNGEWISPNNITVGNATYASRLGNSSNYFTQESLSNCLGWATMSATGVITAADGETTLLS